MAGALDRALRESLGMNGLADERVTILDPATGTGTFLLGIAERVHAQAMAAEGEGMAALALRDLAGRMYGLELLIGPYAVAHYRLHHALRQPRENGNDEVRLPRLGIYLADTLAEPGAAAPAGPLGFVAEGIAEERRAANHLKSAQPILAIIGNPPYKRLKEGENRTLVGQWMDGLWDDLKQPVRDAGQGGQLNAFPDLYVAFWRWALWKLFEADNAPQQGVVAFITNRTFLTGWPYAGLRQKLRQRFDRIEIIDLRGDERSGPRGDVQADEGVFNIKVGTAITIAIADGTKAPDALAEINYNDSWAQGHFSRAAKLQWLAEGTDAGALPGGAAVVRGPLEDMRPTPFQNGEWLSLRECFTFALSGVQTKRDDFVYSVSRDSLTQRITEFVAAAHVEAEGRFHSTRDRNWHEAHAIAFNANFITRVSYRPLDNRHLYNHRAYGDFLRPELQRVWGVENTALYAMPSGTGAGPAVWCHGLLPDYHSFSGRGGYAFPLYDRRPEVNGPNIAPGLLTGLSAAYGRAVAAQEIFDAILCLLSASSYSRRFAEDLEDVFPHAPFPAAPEVFARAAALGAHIRAIETFAAPPAAAFMPAAFVRLADEPRGPVASVTYADGGLALCADGSGRITGLPLAVWTFAVSGYPVLRRWLEARQGQPANLAFVREFRDICGRIAALIELFGQADILLEETLSDSLMREALQGAG